MTREQVIKGLYEIHAYFRESVNAMRGGTADCTVFNGWAMTVTDALALLKEQEEQVQIAHEEGFHDGYMQAMSETRPCRECQEFDCDGYEHKAVQWE